MSDEPSIDQVLEKLAQASSPEALVRAHAIVRQAMAKRRRATKKEYGNLAQVYEAAIKIWDKDKSDGVMLEQRVERLALSLRAVWPQTREWKYLCANCDDCGLLFSFCPGDSTCGDNPATHRPRPPHRPHEFGKPCWCSLGKPFREKAPTDENDFPSVGKRTRRSPTRFGR